MKTILLFAASFFTLNAVAQPKLITQAIVTTSTNVIAPDEEDDVTQIQPQGGGEGRGGGMGRQFANMLDGETKSTTYIKNDLVKTDLKSETLKATMFRDNTAKTTTTFYEMMGNKNGIRSTDGDAEIMEKRIDSMRNERMKTDTTIKARPKRIEPTTSVIYLDETKKIAGYNCKKALVILDRILRKDTTVIWYNPEIKFANVPSTGGMSGIPMMGRQMQSGPNFEKVNGFVMQYEQNMPRGRKMEVKVTKIVMDKEIAVTEFEMPKDIEVKNMRDMNAQGGMRGMFGGGRPQ